MVLIKGLESTTIWKAFFLNSLASSIVILLAITIKDKIDNYTNIKGGYIERTTSIPKLLITFIVTFIASYSSYTLLYLIFGYGGGQLV